MGEKRKKLEKQAHEAHQLASSTDNHNANANGVDSEALLAQVENIKKDCLNRVKEKEYGITNQQVKGLEILEQLLKKHTKPESKKPRWKAGWDFLTSIEFDAGDKFRPYNSGYEKTNGHGMNTMQHLKKDSKRVVNTCAPTSDLSFTPSLAPRYCDARVA